MMSFGLLRLSIAWIELPVDALTDPITVSGHEESINFFLDGGTFQMIARQLQMARIILEFCRFAKTFFFLILEWGAKLFSDGGLPRLLGEQCEPIKFWRLLSSSNDNRGKACDS